jgi:hypothetical protein
LIERNVHIRLTSLILLRRATDYIAFLSLIPNHSCCRHSASPIRTLSLDSVTLRRRSWRARRRSEKMMK